MNHLKKARIHLDGTVALYDNSLKVWRRIPACLVPDSILEGMSEKERSFIEMLVNRPVAVSPREIS